VLQDWQSPPSELWPSDPVHRKQLQVELQQQAVGKVIEVDCTAGFSGTFVGNSGIGGGIEAGLSASVYNGSGAD
jgi:hypothetical protein